MSTSSRIEAKHNALKKFINSSTRLSELFEVFMKVEKQEISTFSDEVSRINKDNQEIISKFGLLYFTLRFSSNYPNSAR